MLKQEGVMKRPHLPKLDLHSLGLLTSLELAAGGLLTALLLRWVTM